MNSISGNERPLRVVIVGAGGLIMVYGTSTTFNPAWEGRIESSVEKAPLPVDWVKYLEYVQQPGRKIPRFSLGLESFQSGAKAGTIPYFQAHQRPKSEFLISTTPCVVGKHLLNHFSVEIAAGK